MKVIRHEDRLWVGVEDHQKAVEFARKAAATVEREECAKLCEQGLNIMTSDSALEWMEVFGEKFAAAIRARGDK
jgi:hypothetical protein